MPGDAPAGERLIDRAGLDFLLFDRIVLAWIRLWQAEVAHRTASPLAPGKLAACRYVFGYELPQIDALARPLLERDRLLVDLDDEWL